MDELKQDFYKMEDGDLGNGPSSFLPEEQLSFSCYNTEKFKICYRELQKNLAFPIETERNIFDGTKSSLKRKSLSLSLRTINKPTSPNDVPVQNFDNTNANSRGTSSFSDSSLSTPDGNEHNCLTYYSFNSVSCFATSPCPRKKIQKRNTKSTIPETTDHSARKILSVGSIFEKFRNLFRNIRKQRPLTSERKRSLSADQLYELEEQVETYKQLSESNKKATEILKHQLMEALYDRVLVQLEKKHERRQLEHELMNLEWELALLQQTTENSQRNWSTKFDSIMADKNDLVQHLRSKKETNISQKLHSFQKSLERNMIEVRRCSI